MSASPLHQTPQAPPRPDTIRSTGVLLVEDDPDAALVAGMVLEINGFTVKVADTATAAVIEMTAFDPIAVVIDLGLGDGQAFELIEQINKMTGKKVPVIALSGLHRSNIFERCLNLGISDLISKPFSPSELLDRITACVRV
ncbi:MAG: response regulator transcription factor [Actinomycetota bacterium]